MTSTTNILLRARIETARSILADAGRLAQKMQPPPGGPKASLKAAQDWLTEADGSVEKFIYQRIHAAFPEDGFLGEEGGVSQKGLLNWIVDPIDGTSNYARGRPRWCISLGLMEGTQAVGGVIYAPALGEFYTAQTQEGAFLNGKEIRASQVDNFSIAMIEMGWSNHVSTETYCEKMSIIRQLGAMPRSGGCGALALTDVACGRQDGYLEMVINLWDVAAALVILQEAGAVTSDFIKQGGMERGTPILAANPILAEELAKAFAIPLS